jgi:hypothetical protein
MGIGYLRRRPGKRRNNQKNKQNKTLANLANTADDALQDAELN